MTGSSATTTTTLSLSLAVVLLSIAQLLTFYHHVQDGHYVSLFPSTAASTTIMGTTPIIVDQAQQVLHSIMLGLSSPTTTTDFAATATTSTARDKDNTKRSEQYQNTPEEIVNNGNNSITTRANTNTDTKKSGKKLEPPGADSCSCWNPAHTCHQLYNRTCWREAERCCHRTLHVNHKMGNILLQELRGMRILTGVNQHLFPPHYHNKQYFEPSRRFNHRAVFIMRNLADSIISGYLFHKAGQECWLDGYGNKVKGGNGGGTMHHVPWAKLMTKKEGYQFAFPWNRTKLGVPAFKRDICEYLAQESEEVGMKAFADFALGYWYSVNYEFLKLSRQKEDAENRMTMFVCYETLASPDTKQQTVRKMMQWLHPAGGYASRDIPQQKKKEYAGGHSTNPDPELRGRLKAILRRLDRDVFGNFIAKTDEAFGCGRRR